MSWQDGAPYETMCDVNESISAGEFMDKIRIFRLLINGLVHCRLVATHKMLDFTIHFMKQAGA